MENNFTARNFLFLPFLRLSEMPGGGVGKALLISNSGTFLIDLTDLIDPFCRLIDIKD